MAHRMAASQRQSSQALRRPSTCSARWPARLASWTRWRTQRRWQSKQVREGLRVPAAVDLGPLLASLFLSPATQQTPSMLHSSLRF